MFSLIDGGRSSFKPTPYNINATRENLQNNLALMGINYTPAQQVKKRLVEADFTPAGLGVGIWKSLRLGI